MYVIILFIFIKSSSKAKIMKIWLIYFKLHDENRPLWFILSAFLCAIFAILCRTEDID